MYRTISLVPRSYCDSRSVQVRTGLKNLKTVNNMLFLLLLILLVIISRLSVELLVARLVLWLF